VPLGSSHYYYYYYYYYLCYFFLFLSVFSEFVHIIPACRQCVSGEIHVFFAVSCSSFCVCVYAFVLHISLRAQRNPYTHPEKRRKSAGREVGEGISFAEYIYI
jgi:Ca2+/H+ antiporter